MFDCTSIIDFGSFVLLLFVTVGGQVFVDVVLRGNRFIPFVPPLCLKSHEFAKDSHLFLLMLLEIKPIKLPLSQLVVVVVEGFLCHSDLSGCRLEGVPPLSLAVHLLIEVSPMRDALSHFPDSSFLHFLLLAGRGGLGQLLGRGLALLAVDVPKPDFDGTVEEELVLQEDLLLEGEAADVHVQFAGDVEVEDVTVAQVKTFISFALPAAHMLLIALDMLISRAMGT
jgi:hypothetical protein